MSRRTIAMVQRLCRRRPRRAGAESGSMTLFWALAGVAFLALLALVVDGGGKLAASAEADDLAAEAARTGGQQIDPAQAIPGDAVVVDPDAAIAAARSYLAQAGAGGTVDITAGGTRLEVSVTDTYHCRMLSAFGYSSMPVTGHGTAHLVHQVGG